MNSLVEFLSDNNARVSFESKWMCAKKEEKSEDVLYTVYERTYGKKKTTVLYEGYYLSTAIKFLSGKVQ